MIHKKQYLNRTCLRIARRGAVVAWRNGNLVTSIFRPANASTVASVSNAASSTGSSASRKSKAPKSLSPSRLS